MGRPSGPTGAPGCIEGVDEAAPSLGPSFFSMALESFCSEASSDFTLSEEALDGSVELSASDFASSVFWLTESLLSLWPSASLVTGSLSLLPLTGSLTFGESLG